MWIAGAGRGLGERLIAGWCVDSGSGVARARMAYSWKSVRPHHDLPDFQIPNSEVPNSEFRMGYAGFEIPHHEVAGLGGAHERHADPGRM
jgi:hypothetical protein